MGSGGRGLTSARAGPGLSVLLIDGWRADVSSSECAGELVLKNWAELCCLLQGSLQFSSLPTHLRRGIFCCRMPAGSQC